VSVSPRSGDRAKACSAAVALALLLAAAPAAAGASLLGGSAQVEFSGSSTLHGFEGKAPAVAFSVTDDEHGRWPGKVEVPAASLDTGNAWRDRNLRRMLDAEHHPSLVAVVDALDADAVRQARALPFVLTLRDRAHAETATLTNWSESERHLEFDAHFSVSLARYGLEAPAALFMRVDDELAVTVHVSLERR
jgi:polyisoprenoid-binding protein YceI